VKRSVNECGADTAVEEGASECAANRRVSKECYMPMSWLAVVAGIATVVTIVRVSRTWTSVRRLDTGSVSERWIAEHCVGSENNVSR
jgi:hypothetical protein